MTCYIISYDLGKPDRDYDALYDAIKAYDRWAHINDSVWAIVTSKTAVQVRDNLLKQMDSNDRLFVIRSGIEAAWNNVRCRNEWLKENL